MLEPKYQILADLLERRLFRVPNYQRPYSWETKQRNDLFSDIEHLLKYSDDRHHYMATIVCLDRKKTESIGADEYKTLEIVDGQQRLTTLIILLRAIAKNLTNSKTSKKLKEELEGLLVKADKRLILLQINHDTNAIFSDYLKKGKMPDENKLKAQAELNLYNAFIECEKFVHNWIENKKRDNSACKIVAPQIRICFLYFGRRGSGLYYI